MQFTETFEVSDSPLAALGTAERLATEGGRDAEARLHPSESRSRFEQQLSKQSRSEKEFSNLLHGHSADAQ